MQTKSGVASGLGIDPTVCVLAGLATRHTNRSYLSGAYAAMCNFPSINLDQFDNTDPRILTVLVIGTEENVKAHILRQHTLGVAEAGTWSKPIPVPNCPDKVMRVLNRIMV